VGTKDKRERKIRQNHRTVAADDLLAVLRDAGFDCQQGGTGPWSCRHDGSGAWCNVAPAHGRGDGFLLAPYVTRALDALDQARAWEAARAAKDDQP
jgi:hypothetical protein